MTRLSLGVQTFQPTYLKFLGRGHDRVQALKAFALSRKAGFKNLSLDLMFGFPGQTKEELESDLIELIQMKSEHVSLYTLTIEPNSRFHAQKVLLDDEAKLGQFYTQVVETLGAAGIEQYEVSNFSRPGFASRHNRHYWLGGEYIGLGVGAHSHRDGKRSWNVSSLPLYFQKLKESDSAVDGCEALSLETQFMERVLFGLRMNEGIDVDGIQNQMGLQMSSEKRALLHQWTSDGLLVSEGSRFQTTLQGRLVLDELSARLI